MTRGASIFNEINSLPRFGLSQADIARSSGLQTSLVSRFLNGREVNLGNFLRLIDSMPEEFQQLYWRKLLSDKVFKDPPRDWRMIIQSASIEDIAEILEAISGWWSDLIKSGKFNPKDENKAKELRKKLCLK